MGNLTKKQTLNNLEETRYEETTHWRCSKWRSCKCPKTLMISGSNIISNSNKHSQHNKSSAAKSANKGDS